MTTTLQSSVNGGLQMGANAGSSVDVAGILNDYTANKTENIELNDDNTFVDNNNTINYSVTQAKSCYVYAGNNLNPYYVCNSGNNQGNFNGLVVWKKTGDMFVSGSVTIVNNTDLRLDPNATRNEGNQLDKIVLTKFNPKTRVWTPVAIPRDLWLNYSWSPNFSKIAINNTKNMLYILVDFNYPASDNAWGMLLRYDLNTSTFSYVLRYMPNFDNLPNYTTRYTTATNNYGSNIKKVGSVNGSEIGRFLSPQKNNVQSSFICVDEPSNTVYLVSEFIEAPTYNTYRKVYKINENSGGYITQLPDIVTPGGDFAIANISGIKYMNNKLFVYGQGGNDLQMYDGVSWKFFYVPHGQGVADVICTKLNEFYVATDTYTASTRYFGHYKIAASANTTTGYVNGPTNGYWYKDLIMPDGAKISSMDYDSATNLIYLCSLDVNKIYKLLTTTNTFSTFKSNARTSLKILKLDNSFYLLDNGSNTVLYGYNLLNTTYKMSVKYNNTTLIDSNNTFVDFRKTIFYVELKQFLDSVYPGQSRMITSM